MPDVVNSMLPMFADDTKLYRTITSVHDNDALQQDINNISAWGEQSSMSFNLDECHVMTFGRSQQHHSYTMMNADGVLFPLQRYYEQQDWGYCLLPTLNLGNISVRKRTRLIVYLVS